MATNPTIFPPPYVRGQIGYSETSSRLLHMILAIMFVVTPLMHIVATYFFIPVDIVFSLIWLVLGLLVFWNDSYGRILSGLLAMDVFLITISLSGFPGMLSQIGAGTLLFTLGYGFFLFVRNMCLFSILPRQKSVDRVDFLQITTWWLFWGAVAVISVSFVYMTANGFTIFGGGRFVSERWLHPNNVSIYAGLAIILAAMCQHIKLWARIFAVCLGLYIVVVCQSRGVIVTFAVTLMFLFMLNSTKRFFKNLVLALVIGVVLALVIPTFAPAVMELGPIKDMMDRTFKAADPTTGRVTIVSQAIEVWQRDTFSWLFGYGWKGAMAVDNAIVSFGLEAGLAGLVLYFIFVLVVLIKAFLEFYTNKDPKIQRLAKFSVVFTIYILVRSLVERSHVFQLSDLVSNSWMLFAGYLYAQTTTVDFSKARREKWFEHLTTRQSLSGPKPGEKPKLSPLRPRDPEPTDC